MGVILTSQSGETSDTLSALRKAKEYNLKTVAITNVSDKFHGKEDDAIITLCGEEVVI